jgi:hypothetical protein
MNLMLDVRCLPGVEGQDSMFSRICTRYWRLGRSFSSLGVHSMY